MPYNSSTGVISIDTTTTPQTGISIADIQDALSMSASDLGQLIVQGASRGKINPWAMFKPVRDPSWRWVNRPYSSSSVGLSLGALGFGTTLPYSQTIQGLLDYYADTTIMGGKPANGWRYLAPRGIANSEPFRMFDFGRVVDGVLVAGDGYCSHATIPFGTFAIGTANVSRHGGQLNAYQITRHLAGGSPDTYITITDFNTILASGVRMLYYGVLFAPSHTDYAFKIVGNVETSIVDGVTDRGGETMALESTTLTTGWQVDEYTAYPFLMNAPFAQNQHVIDKSYEQRTQTLDFRMYPLPGAVPLVLNVFEFYIAINVHATTAQEIGGVYTTQVYYTIKNNYNESVTITNLEMKIRSVNDWSTSRQAGEVFYDKAYRYDDSAWAGTADNTYASFLANVTLASGEEKRIPAGSLSSGVTLPSADTNVIFIGCTYGSGAQYGSVSVRIPASGGNQVEVE